MGVVKNAEDKFYANIEKSEVNELFFRYGAEECQISFWGRYIIVENRITHEAEEFCFAENGKALVEALLAAKVLHDKSQSIRDILVHLPEDELIITN